MPKFGTLDVFNQIYKEAYWGNGSGPGSHYNKVLPYVDYVQSFFKAKKIYSIVDLGCGDWQFSQYINFDNVRYLGVDVAVEIIESNKIKYESNNIKFQVMESYKSLPRADLLICKDVFQHLSQKEIYNILENVFPKYQFILLTNCSSPYSKFGNYILKAINNKFLYNRNIEIGGYTYFDIRKKPYNQNAKVVLDWKVGKWNWSKLKFNFLWIIKHIIHRAMGRDCDFRKKTMLLINNNYSIL